MFNFQAVLAPREGLYQRPLLLCLVFDFLFLHRVFYFPTLCLPRVPADVHTCSRRPCPWCSVFFFCSLAVSARSHTRHRNSTGGSRPGSATRRRRRDGGGESAIGHTRTFSTGAAEVLDWQVRGTMSRKWIGLFLVRGKALGFRLVGGCRQPGSQPCLWECSRRYFE